MVQGGVRNCYATKSGLTQCTKYMCSCTPLTELFVAWIMNANILCLQSCVCILYACAINFSASTSIDLVNIIILNGSENGQVRKVLTNHLNPQNHLPTSTTDAVMYER